MPAYITATAVSPTGAYLAFGDNEGVIHLMSAAEEGVSIPFNGFEGRPIEWADTPEPLPEIEWRDTTYVKQLSLISRHNPVLQAVQRDRHALLQRATTLVVDTRPHRK